MKPDTFAVEPVERTRIREPIEWISIRWHDETDPARRRVLLVGDSIVVGHGTKVHERLAPEGLAVDYFATAKHVADEEFLPDLAFMLERHAYEMILFNNGLHGFGIDDALYAPALRETFGELRQRTPRLTWRNSTPMLAKGDPASLDEEHAPRIARRNAEALALARETGLPVLDLYTPMAARRELFLEDAVHYTEAGQEIQADLVAAFVRERMEA